MVACQNVLIVQRPIKCIARGIFATLIYIFTSGINEINMPTIQTQEIVLKRAYTNTPTGVIALRDCISPLYGVNYACRVF